MKMSSKPSRLLAVPCAGLVAVLALVLSACGGPSAAPTTTTSTLPPLPPSVYAYVTLAGTGTNLGFGDHVVAVDVTAGAQAVGSRFAVGTYPDAIAIDGSMAYVANYTSNSVTPIDLATGRSLKPISVGTGPADIAISAKLDRAYVTDDGSSSALGDTVTPIDLKTLKALAPITVGAGPQGIAITPNGLRAYVADAGAIVAGQSGPIGHTVTPIDLSSGRAERPITVGNGPTGIAISPDGGTVFVTNLDSLSVSPINVATDRALAPIAVPGGPVAVAVAGGYAWVVDTPSSQAPGNNVVPIALASDRAGKPIAVAKGVQSIAISPDGKTAWVTCLNADEIQSIDLASHKVASVVSVPGGPFAVALATRSAGGASSTPSTGSKGSKKRSKKGS
jgi:YVTN family beta-propeller protein